MRQLAFTYIATLLAFVAADAVWLSVMGPAFYYPEVGPLLLETPNLAVAAVFYLLYPVGLLALAVRPGLSEAHASGALWRAALFGLCAYATYDISNLATLKGWTVTVTVVDLVWGVLGSSVAALAGYAAGRAVKP